MFHTFVGGGPGSEKTCAMIVRNRKLKTERGRLSALALRGAKRNLTCGARYSPPPAATPQPSPNVRSSLRFHCSAEELASSLIMATPTSDSDEV